MEKVARKFSSFEEADRADEEYYRNLTPQQRLDILLEILQRGRAFYEESDGRLKRVYRIVKLPRG